MPSSRWLVLLVAAGAVAAGVAMQLSRSGGAAGKALAEHTRDAGADAAAYPRLGAELRARAWITTGPSQPSGVDLFTGLDDARFGRERIIVPADLQASIRLIRGLAWDPSAKAWKGGGRSVPMAEIRALLDAALPTRSDAEAVVDLLVGMPAPGAPDFAAMLRAEPSTLEAIRIVPFQGDRGHLLLDRGHPPYVSVERGYSGLAAGFTGAGWPAGWRLLRLRGVAP